MSNTFNYSSTVYSASQGSPDGIGLTDLTLYDTNPTTLYQNALNAYQTLFPGWLPYAGSTEVVLMQTFATIAAEMIFAINRVPQAVLTSLVNLFGITPLLGSPPTASVTFTMANTLGYTIPGGTVVTLSLSEGRTFSFTTDSDLVIAPGQNSGTVTVTCTQNTSIPNGTPTGTTVQVSSGASPWVDTASLATPVSGGTDPEDLNARLNRAMNVMQTLVATLMSPAQFKAAALAIPGVWRCLAIDQCNSTNPSSWVLGTAAEGYVTVAVYAQGGSPCSSAVKNQVQSTLSAAAYAPLNVNVVDAVVTEINVTCSVTRQTANSANTPAAVQSAVQTAVGQWLNTDTWPWNGTLWHYKLAQIIENAPGVDTLESLTLTSPTAGISANSAGDVVLSLPPGWSGNGTPPCLATLPPNVPLANSVTVNVLN